MTNPPLPSSFPVHVVAVLALTGPALLDELKAPVFKRVVAGAMFTATVAAQMGVAIGPSKVSNSMEAGNPLHGRNLGTLNNIGLNVRYGIWFNRFRTRALEKGFWLIGRAVISTRLLFVARQNQTLWLYRLVTFLEPRASGMTQSFFQ